MRHTAEYSLLDHRRNEDILEELKVYVVEKKLAQHKQKCKHMLVGCKTLDTQNNGFIWTFLKKTWKLLKRMLKT
jgi:hypothetical protein